jgi:hypothetical protein
VKQYSTDKGEQMTKTKLTDEQKKARRELHATGQSHADADYKCGRKWTCFCGACRRLRDAGWKPTQERTALAMPF